MLLAVPGIIAPNLRFFDDNDRGVDTEAYLQQAYQVQRGVTDYTKISSYQGPCYYPAGHLYHYLLALPIM